MNTKTNFCIDPRILASSFKLADWPLCSLLLKNNAEFPWLILVPRVEQLVEIDDLPQQLRYQLIDEIAELSSIVRSYFKPDKINVAYLGNMVSQFHVHIVARFAKDKLWPHGIWQASQANSPYQEPFLSSLVEELGAQINRSFGS